MSTIRKYPLIFVVVLMLFVSFSSASWSAQKPSQNSMSPPNVPPSDGIPPKAVISIGGPDSQKLDSRLSRQGGTGMTKIQDSQTNPSNNREDSSNPDGTVGAKKADAQQTDFQSRRRQPKDGSSTGGAVPQNISSSSVHVEPFTGSANLSIPIAVPPGRAGIQPNLALTYSSSSRQLGLAGVGWTLDLGAIQISTKKGAPKYDSSDIYTLIQGSSQDLVYDSNTNSYRTEVEGAFARIKKVSDHWEVTDRKGVKYYFGNTDDSRQYDPANSSHVFRWALNRVEDLNGNYMTVSYMKDQGQIYPQTIQYTGNSQKSLSPYAQVSINYANSTIPSSSYIQGFGVVTALRLDRITVFVNGNDVNSNNQPLYKLAYTQSRDTGRDLLQSITQIGSDDSTLPPVSFSYSTMGTNGSVTFSQASGWNIPSGLLFWDAGRGVDRGVRVADLNGDGYPDFVRDDHDCNGWYVNQVYINNKNKGWDATDSWKSNITHNSDGLNPGFVDNCPEIDRYTGLALVDVTGDGVASLMQNYRRDLYWGGQYIQNS